MAFTKEHPAGVPPEIDAVHWTVSLLSSETRTLAAMGLSTRQEAPHEHAKKRSGKAERNMRK